MASRGLAPVPFTSVGWSEGHVRQHQAARFPNGFRGSQGLLALAVATCSEWSPSFSSSPPRQTTTSSIFFPSLGLAFVSCASASPPSVRAFVALALIVVVAKNIPHEVPKGVPQARSVNDQPCKENRRHHKDAIEKMVERIGHTASE
eukprot:CAMPEP_0117551774 /NCGR_PEP_ID=MMETSP0784-20121206/49363_1 /TAXON_ID=39447 /ORGANISM="" /LENGTH=146 /DNA_ID=CAMNT_0005348821 /DNA_START=8 /DNA_END=445 /DNA_ORIENTATION=+